jgi:hypothetical protein
LQQVIEVLTSNLLTFADTGRMSREGISYFETPHEITAVYNTAQLLYIIYQEEGTRYFKGNMEFIKTKAKGKIEQLIYSDMLGIPYNNLEDNQILLDNRSLMMTELGVFKDV